MKKREKIWLYLYTFELLSAKGGAKTEDFVDRVQCLAVRDEQAFANVATRVGGCNPPIHTIRMVDRVWLQEKPDDVVLELLKSLDHSL
jgi:hypothetical protein